MTALERLLAPELFHEAEPDEPRLRKWTRAEYYRMAETGILGPEDHVELLEGVIFLKWTDGERRRWTCEEYERMGDVGLLRPGERVELINGEVLEMSPQRSLHSTGVSLAYEALRSCFGAGFYVRQQLPLRLFASIEPEPDLAVVSGAARDYRDRHPDTALLVLEVSDTNLAYDQGLKANLYASVGIQDYWIADLVRNRIEVRREPIAMPGEPYDWGYRSITLFLPGKSLTPLALPGSVVAVEDLLPTL